MSRRIQILEREVIHLKEHLKITHERRESKGVMLLMMTENMLKTMVKNC